MYMYIMYVSSIVVFCRVKVNGCIVPCSWTPTMDWLHNRAAKRFKSQHNNGITPSIQAGNEWIFRERRGMKRSSEINGLIHQYLTAFSTICTSFDA